MVKKPLTMIIIGLTAAGLGLLAGALSAGFLYMVDFAQRWLWGSPWANAPLAPFFVCTVGGLLVGLCQHFWGDHPKNIQEAVDELRATGRLDYTHLPQGVLTVGVSLIFGASLGPEAAIMDLLGGLGTWVADQLKRLRARLSLPAQAPGASRGPWLARQWQNLLLWGGASVGFIALARGLYSGGFLNMSEAFQWSDLLWSAPLALIGVLAGVFFRWLQSFTLARLAPWRAKPILRATLAGAVLGGAATVLPMMLFSGQHDLQAIYQQAAALGPALLLLIALVRLLLIALLLNSGWKGGQFLPLMFASAALGLAIIQVAPAVSAPASVLAVMTGLLAAALPKPVIALVIVALLFPPQYVGIPIVATLTVLALKRLRSLGARHATG